MDVEEDLAIATDGVEAKDSAHPLTLDDISSNLLYITKGVELNQPRLLHRAIRQNFSIRRHADRSLLQKIVERHVPVDTPTYAFMQDFISQLPAATDAVAMEVELEPESAPGTSFLPLAVLPEVEVYLFTLVVTSLLRAGQDSTAAAAARQLVDRIRGWNRRSLDVFSAKAFFYFALAHEKIGQAAAVRPMLLALYRTASVRRDVMGQAVLLNALLRGLLAARLVDQAHVLSLRVTFPEHASNNQFCRYLYYLGRIQAVQLQYSEAFARLSMAARKAPAGAGGFLRGVQKLSVLVQLLMGDVPERALFNAPGLRVALAPYLALTQAVRGGDLRRFEAVVAAHRTAFAADQNLSLVLRLGHNVLKTGLRKLAASYSRIPLAEAAARLQLPGAEAAEFVCAKAVRDGVLEARIDHARGWLACTEVEDIYSTEEPQRAFHKRIAFCLDVHNEAVKSMRYPPAKQTFKEAGGGQGDEERAIEDLIKDLEEDFDE